MLTILPHALTRPLPKFLTGNSSGTTYVTIITTDFKSIQNREVSAALCFRCFKPFVFGYVEYFGIWIDVEGKLQGLEVNPGRGTRGPWGQIWNIQIEKRLSRIQANRHKYTQELKHIDTSIETHRHKHWNTKTQALKHIDTSIEIHRHKHWNTYKEIHKHIHTQKGSQLEAKYTNYLSSNQNPFIYHISRRTVLSLSLLPQTQFKVAKMSTDRYLWHFPLSTASDQIQKFVFSFANLHRRWYFSLLNVNFDQLKLSKNCSGLLSEHWRISDLQIPSLKWRRIDATEPERCGSQKDKSRCRLSLPPKCFRKKRKSVEEMFF